ncbi:hypothetical protein [Aureispira sp. CCB-QB1]|uniref:hypothetical protein n=1 Tax=Aureispira sp. CCB-QB1 TaxID=1313421 RepID=UPI000696027B|nr:hypothetical protein [Aureispira sp. CCB-QB1]
MIRTYIDTKLISNIKTVLHRGNVLSKEFDHFKSLYNFLIGNKKNELFLAEKNIIIKPDELESLMKREGELPISLRGMKTNEYIINSSFDFKDQKKSTVLVFIELGNEEIENLGKRIGYFFSNSHFCAQKWQKVSINNIYSKSFSISFRNHQGKEFEFNRILNSYSLNCNSILISDRYLRTWTRRDIIKNLIPLFKAFAPNKECEEFFLTIITSEQNNTHSSLTMDEMHNFIYTELSADYNIKLSTICVYEDDFKDQERIDVQNIMHDRHLMTNYLHLPSLHSFDINGSNGVKKDSEMTIKSLLESSHFSNSERKRKSYKKLLDKIVTNPTNFKFIGDYKLNLIFKEICT